MRVGETGTPGVGAPPLDKASQSPKDEFLRLLVAQLEHQNPLEPQSGADFIAQLAQFASVEQSTATNSLLASIQAEQAAAGNLEVAGLAGKTVSLNANSFEYDGKTEGVPDLSIDLASPAEEMDVVIYDANGNEVNRFKMGAQKSGEVQVPWKAVDKKGVALEAGAYSIQVEATNADGVPVEGVARLRGTIDVVDFSKGFPLLQVGGISIAPSQVLTIG